MVIGGDPPESAIQALGGGSSLSHAAMHASTARNSGTDSGTHTLLDVFARFACTFPRLFGSHRSLHHHNHKERPGVSTPVPIARHV